MELTVNHQTVKKVAVNRQKWKILTVNRQLNQTLLAVKRQNKLMYENFSFDSPLILIITLVRDSSNFRLETLPVSKNISYLLI